MVLRHEGGYCCNATAWVEAVREAYDDHNDVKAGCTLNRDYRQKSRTCHCRRTENRAEVADSLSHEAGCEETGDEPQGRGYEEGRRLSVVHPKTV